MAALPALVLSLIPSAGTGPPTQDLRTFLAAPQGRADIVNPDACAGGLRNDDGSYEGAVGYANAVQEGAYVMAFDIAPGFGPERVCLCWTRGPFNNGTDVDFNVVFYAANGKGSKGELGFPGTFLGSVAARANDVPEFQKDGVAMYPVALPEFARGLSGRIYVGAEWQPFVNRQFFLCNDAEPAGMESRPVHEGFSNVPPAPLWSIISPMRPTYRSFGTVLYGNPIFASGLEDVLLHDGFECLSGQPGCPAIEN